MQIVRIGLDLAKYVFEVHGVDCHGKTVLRRTLRRGAVMSFFANLPPCLVGMEASNGAHFWAKALSDLGHAVRLISPQFVTPYVKSNKNDRNDAEASGTVENEIKDRLVAGRHGSEENKQLGMGLKPRSDNRLTADRWRAHQAQRSISAQRPLASSQPMRARFARSTRTVPQPER